MRVILADKQKDVISALQFILQRHFRDWEYVTVTCLPELFQVLAISCPDLLLIDWGLQTRYERNPHPHLGAKNVITVIHQFCPGLYTVVLDINPETEHLAIQLGASAFVCKSDPPETLFLAIQQLIK